MTSLAAQVLSVWKPDISKSVWIDVLLLVGFFLSAERIIYDIKGKETKPSNKCHQRTSVQIALRYTEEKKKGPKYLEHMSRRFKDIMEIDVWRKYVPRYLSTVNSSQWNSDIIFYCSEIGFETYFSNTDLTLSNRSDTLDKNINRNLIKKKQLYSEIWYFPSGSIAPSLAFYLVSSWHLSFELRFNSFLIAIWLLLQYKSNISFESPLSSSVDQHYCINLKKSKWAPTQDYLRKKL